MREIFTVWKKEIQDTLRDRRTLFTAVIMPIFIMPLVLVGSFKLQESQQNTIANQVAVVALSDQSTAPSLTDFLVKQDKIDLQPAPADFQQAIANGTLQAYIDIPADFEPSLASDQPVTLTVYEKSTDTKSATAFQKVQTAILLFNESVAATKLSAADVNPAILHSVTVAANDLATEQERGGYFLGLLLPMFIVIFSIAGGMYIAIDVSAGEKERKTLEAILMAPLSRLKIVSGKFLAVATTAIVSVVFSVASMYAAFKIWPPNLGTALTFDITLGTALLMLGIGVILSVMFAALLLAVGIFAKSFKEAQNYITPFYLLAILPVSIFSSIPGFKPPLALFVVPPLNAVFVFKESLIGETSSSHVLVTLGSLIVASIVSIIIATKIYSKESILFRD
ncbi:MAG: ABC transporter permease [Patescibacteria group bacterium]